jgi:hypothetical protein
VKARAFSRQQSTQNPDLKSQKARKQTTPHPSDYAATPGDTLPRPPAAISPGLPPTRQRMHAQDPAEKQGRPLRSPISLGLTVSCVNFSLLRLLALFHCLSLVQQCQNCPWLMKPVRWNKIFLAFQWEVIRAPRPTSWSLHGDHGL